MVSVCTRRTILVGPKEYGSEVSNADPHTVVLDTQMMGTDEWPQDHEKVKFIPRSLYNNNYIQFGHLYLLLPPNRMSMAAREISTI